MNRITASRLSLIALLASMGLPCAASDYADGIALYKAKNYRAAAVKFEAAMAASPRDANAIYYCALSQQLANNRGRAKQLYEYLVTNFSSSPVAAMAQTGLQQLGGGAAAAPAGGSSATTGSDAPASSGVANVAPARQGEPDYLRNVPEEVRVPLIRHGASKAVYLEAQVNDRPIVFHLDTGAGNTCLGSNQMEAMGLGRPSGRHQFMIGGVGSEAMKGWGQRIDLRVGVIYKRDVPVVVQERMDGEPLLGQDFLQDFNVTVDDANGQIVFRKKSAHPRVTARGTIDIPFTVAADGRHLLVNTLVNNKPYVMYFDTGADSVCFTFKDLKTLGIPAPDGPPSGTSRGVKGDTPTWTVPLDTLQVGKLKREGFQAFVLGESSMDHPLLGQSFFGNYRYTVDSAARVIHLIEPDM